MPIVLMAMYRLLSNVKEAYISRDFNAKLSDGIFNDAWIDYTLETMENKTLKGSGGVIGLTLRGPALAPWFLSRPVTALYSETYHAQMCKIKYTLSQHYQRSSVQQGWNRDVSKLKESFNDTFIDPFDIDDPPSRLTNIATGASATDDVLESLQNALGKGREMERKFVTGCFGPEDAVKSFFSPTVYTEVGCQDV